MIRILVVEDSPLTANLMIKILDSDLDLRVVGVANNGQEAVKLVAELKPDIITMDIMMPRMDGLEATKQIMGYYPTPILILTASQSKKMDSVFQAISFGALDVEEKVGFKDNKINEEFKDRLISKIKFLVNVKVIKHPLAKIELGRRNRADKGPTPAKLLKIGKKRQARLKGILAIAASTGGPNALAIILRRLPKEFSYGIVIVQHIAKSFDQGLADWLTSCSSVKVKLAEDGQEIEPAIAYLAPNDLHIKVKRNGIIELSDDSVCGGFKPSANVMFESVAKNFARDSIAVILTGMGRDGAVGIGAVKKAGGKTIAQNSNTSVVFGMPKEAIDSGCINIVLPLEKIADEILKDLRTIGG